MRYVMNIITSVVGFVVVGSASGRCIGLTLTEYSYSVESSTISHTNDFVDFSLKYHFLSSKQGTQHRMPIYLEKKPIAEHESVVSFFFPGPQITSRSF